MTVKQQTIEAVRARTFEVCRNVAKDLGCALSLSGHFIQRFNLRSSSQLAACGSFQVACYAIKGRYPKLTGKKVFVQVGHHKFIFSLREPGQIVCVTFWQHGAEGNDVDEKIILS